MWEARDVCGGGAGGRNPNEQKRRNKTLARWGWKWRRERHRRGGERSTGWWEGRTTNLEKRGDAWFRERGQGVVQERAGCWAAAQGGAGEGQGRASLTATWSSDFGTRS